MASRAATPTQAAEDGASAPSAPEAPTPAPQIDMSALTDLLLGMNDKLDATQSELRRQAAEIGELKASGAGAGQFRRMDPTMQATLGPQQSRVTDRGDTITDNEKVIPAGVDSHELPEPVLLRYVQDFEAGDPIRIKRDVQRDDCPKTWGEILDGIGPIRCGLASQRFRRGCPGKVIPGEPCPVCKIGPHVKKVHFLNPDGRWVYKVWAHGLTPANGQLMYQDELEAVY